MEGALQKKLRSFLNERRVLQTQYLKLKQETEDQDIETREDLAALHEFDQLVYSYNAIKSYYDVSKSDWAFKDRQPFDLFGDLIPKTEAKLHVGELCDKFNGLQVLRRLLKDNAKEGGKLSHLMMTSSAKPEDWKVHTDQLMTELNELPVDEPMGNSLRAWSSITTKGKSESIKKGPEKKAISKVPNGKTSILENLHQEQQKPQEPRIGNPSELVSISTSPDVVNVPADSKASGKKSSADISINGKNKLATPKASTRLENGTATQKSTGKDKGKDIVSLGKSSENSSSKLGLTAQQNSKRNDNPEERFLNSPALKKQKILPTLSNAVDQESDQPIYTNKLSSQNTPISTSTKRVVSTTAVEPKETSETPESQFGSPPIKRTPMPLSELLNSLKDRTNENTNKKSPEAPASSKLSEKPKRPSSESGSFTQFPTWSKDYVRCIVKAAASQPRAPAQAIQSALQGKCKIKIRLEEAEMLRLHYGLMKATMDNYEYYIQTFHLVATQFSEKRARYVTMPWSDMRVQFARACHLQLEDWDIKGRYNLFNLHRRVYGKQGEPSSNYRDEVEEFKKMYTYRKGSSFLKIKNNAPQDGPSGFPGNAQESSTNGSTKTLAATGNSDIWSPQVFKVLVDGYCIIPEGASKALALIQFIRLKLNVDVGLDQVLEKCKSKEFLHEVKKRLPNQSEDSISKFLAQAPSANSLQPKTSQLDYNLEQMSSKEHTDDYYKAKFKGNLSDFWDFGKTKCIMSTVEYASIMPPNTKVPHFKAVRRNVLIYVKLRLLKEHKVQVPEETIKTRIVRMMELDMFDESQCRLLNEIIHEL